MNKIDIDEITKKLEGYELVKNINVLRENDIVKYIKKEDGKFVNNKTILSGDKKNKTLTLQGYGMNGRQFAYTIFLSDVILFRKID